MIAWKEAATLSIRKHPLAFILNQKKEKGKYDLNIVHIPYQINSQLSACESHLSEIDTGMSDHFVPVLQVYQDL